MKGIGLIKVLGSSIFLIQLLFSCSCLNENSFLNKNNLITIYIAGGFNNDTISFSLNNKTILENKEVFSSKTLSITDYLFEINKINTNSYAVISYKERIPEVTINIDDNTILVDIILNKTDQPTYYFNLRHGKCLIIDKISDSIVFNQYVKSPPFD